MKKYLFILLTAISIPLLSSACDICGCGVGNSYIGILPDFRSHIFGLRYRYNAMQTHIGVGGTVSYLTSSETYQTTEAWAGWNIGTHFRLMASLPYGFNQRSNQGIQTRKNGLGDISLSAYYQLLNKRHTVQGSNILVQDLWLGGGIKMATGEYNPKDKSSTNNNANLFQLGTGSYDFVLNAMYDIRLQDMGMNISASYKLNNENKYHYAYGNKLNLNAQVYYKFRVGNRFTIAPNTGIQYEDTGNDTDNGFTVTVSGGTLFMGTLGVETSFNKIAIGANFQTPVSQNLANGIVKADSRCMIHLAIAL